MIDVGTKAGPHRLTLLDRALPPVTIDQQGDDASAGAYRSTLTITLADGTVLRDGTTDTDRRRPG